MAYLPDYILHFRDGKSVNLWFGSIMAGVMARDRGNLYDFPSHYPEIMRQLPPSLPIAAGGDITHCAKHFQVLDDASIDAALPRSVRRNQ